MEEVGITICRLPGEDGLVQFSNPITCVQTDCLDEVIEKFEQVEAFTKQGFYAVGYVSYEASPAFDSALVTKSKSPSLPLLLFYIYKSKPSHFRAKYDTRENALDLIPEVSKQA